MKRLAHDLLDKQMISADGEKVGRVDGIILQLHQTTAPRVIAVESGIETILRRIHCGGEWLQKVGRWLGVENDGAPAQIPFAKIRTIGIDVRLSLRADEAGTKDWEDWLRQKVIERIPGSGKEKKENQK